MSLESLDIDSDITEGGPFRTQVRLFLHCSVAMVVRALDGPDGGSLSFVGMSPKEMRESQKRDPDLNSFFQWLAADAEPDEGDLFLARPALKYFWINRALFTMDNHQVLWKSTEEESEDRLLVVPKELGRRWSVCVMISQPLVISRTKARLREKFFWYGMMKEAAGFVGHAAGISTPSDMRGRK
jgi:hypothetical protein